MTIDTKRDIAVHIQILAVITAAGTLIFSTMLIISALVLLPAVFIAPLTDLPSGGPLEGLLMGFGGMMLVFATGNLALGLSAAYGLFKRRPWGRVLGLLDSGISLLSFPIGTILGAYGLWVLLPPDAEAYLSGAQEKDLKVAF